MPIDAELRKKIADFVPLIIEGHVNLLLGAGASYGCKNASGQSFMGAVALSRHLEKELGLDESPSRSLSTIYGYDAQKASNEIERLYKCSVLGSGIRNLGKYYWRRIYTLNVDDAAELHYGGSGALRQRGQSLNYTDPYRDTNSKSDVQIVHLHGYVGRPQDGFVFSVTEYNASIRNANNWAVVLSSALLGNPFLIIGTTLEEADLDYFLHTRKLNGGSTIAPLALYVNPVIDKIADKKCRDLGLIQIPLSMDEFFSEVGKISPSVPDVNLAPLSGISADDCDRVERYHVSNFTRSWGRVGYRDMTGKYPDGYRPVFLYGGTRLTYEEIQYGCDMRRASHIDGIITEILRDGPSRVIAISGGCIGNGKSSAVKRVAQEMASSRHLVFEFRDQSRFNAESTSVFIRAMIERHSRIYLVIDDLVANCNQLLRIIQDNPSGVVVIGTTVDVHHEHLRKILSDKISNWIDVDALSVGEIRSLFDVYKRYGLSATVGSGQKFDSFCLNHSKSKTPIGLISCEIMNDFRPYRDIISEHWSTISTSEKLGYLSVALACRYCVDGIQSGVLASDGRIERVDLLVGRRSVFGLTLDRIQGNDFLYTRNTAVSDFVIRNVAENSNLATAIDVLSCSLAPFVNRMTIKAGNPEARLAGNLFRYKAIESLVGTDESFRLYAKMEKSWSENSRFWEQRALLELNHGQWDLAHKYAMHAVTIENHPHPHNTLANVYFFFDGDRNTSEANFVAGVESAMKAYRMESEMSRIAILPVVTLIKGFARFYKKFNFAPSVLQANTNVALALRAQMHRWEKDEDAVEGGALLLSILK